MSISAPRVAQATSAGPLERVSLERASRTAAPSPVAPPAGPRRAPAALPSRDAAQLIDAGRRASPTLEARPASAMVALRMVAGAPKIADADVGKAVLSVQLHNPATGQPPTVDQVAGDMLALLRGTVAKNDGGQLSRIATQPTEGYYVVTYHEASGELALRQVAAGDARTVTVSADDVAKAVRPGEALLGGLHNHPNKKIARASEADAVASGLLAQRFRGYMDVVIAGASVSATQVRASAVTGDADQVTFNAWRPNQMNRDSKKPDTVDRVDSPHVDVSDSQNHIHFHRMRQTRDEDGGWGHGKGDDSLLTNEEKKWIKKWDQK